MEVCGWVICTHLSPSLLCKFFLNNNNMWFTCAWCSATVKLCILLFSASKVVSNYAGFSLRWNSSKYGTVGLFDIFFATIIYNKILINLGFSQNEKSVVIKLLGEANCLSASVLHCLAHQDLRSLTFIGKKCNSGALFILSSLTKLEILNISQNTMTSESNLHNFKTVAYILYNII